MAKLIRIRKSRRGECLVSVPRDLADRIAAEYMSVYMNEAGRLIYTPIEEAA